MKIKKHNWIFFILLFLSPLLFCHNVTLLEAQSMEDLEKEGKKPNSSSHNYQYTIHWKENGTMVNATSGSNRFALSTSDGNGGAIIVWTFDNGPDNDISIQKLDENGEFGWGQTQIIICDEIGNQGAASIISDGMGGAIVCWGDMRGADNDIYIQRVDTDGNILWKDNGTLVCGAVEEQTFSRLASDEEQGAFVVWRDYRNSNDYNIYLQHVNSTGNATWVDNGIAICNDTNLQTSPMITSDGMGGCIVAWLDDRSGDSYDIYTQRVNKSGDIYWKNNGTVIKNATGDGDSVQIISDGMGGAVLVWEDRRVDTGDIYAQHINAAGITQWRKNGTAICNATQNQNSPELVIDSNGDVFLTWRDNRPGANYNVYAQKIDLSGTTFWRANGTLVANSSQYQLSQPQIVLDGNGGVIISWLHIETLIDRDFFANHLNSSGNVQWGGYGAPITTYYSIKEGMTMVSDGNGGAILVWEDPILSPNYHIFSQRISDFEPNIAPVVSNPSPVDAATNIELTMSLKVDISDSEGQDITVYFYDDSNTLLGQKMVSGGSGSASVNWNGLDYSTTYSWYVKASDGLDSTTSPTWSFTTKDEDTTPANNDDTSTTPTSTNNAPTVSGPKPKYLETGIPINTTLQVNVTDADGQDVSVSFYDGSDTLLGKYTVSGGSGKASLNWSELSYSTNYTWYVKASDGIDTVTSSTWTFRTIDKGQNQDGLLGPSISIGTFYLPIILISIVCIVFSRYRKRNKLSI